MWKMIAVPVVGAIIGYITNWIAVKMLFRPRYEKKIGNWRVPFTPGIIPKGQPRLAKAIGRAVETQLLTADVMRNLLLSDEMKAQMKEKLDQWMQDRKESSVTVKDTALEYMDEDSWSELKLFLTEEGSAFIMRKLMEMNPGKTITDKVVEAANEKLAESMFGMMLGGGFLDGIAAAAEVKINEYLEENGESYLQGVFWKELEGFQDKTTGELLTTVEEKGFNIQDMVLALYEKVLDEHMEDLVASLHFSKVVEDRINQMKVEEVEDLVLSIMKKELGAVVNLGAVIGFLLGLINVAILYI